MNEALRATLGLMPWSWSVIGFAAGVAVVAGAVVGLDPAMAVSVARIAGTAALIVILCSAFGPFEVHPRLTWTGIGMLPSTWTAVAVLGPLTVG